MDAKRHHISRWYRQVISGIKAAPLQVAEPTVAP